jgi:hypothetical protein
VSPLCLISISHARFHIVGLCVFSHQSADYCMVVAHLTFNSFEGHPCCMHADYLPSLCFWYSPTQTRRMSTRTVRNRLKSAGLKSRRVLRRPLLADRHRRTRLAWCLARRGWNLRTWPRSIDQTRAGFCVVCRILASLSHSRFVCVFSPVGWLQYSGSPSDVQ